MLILMYICYLKFYIYYLIVFYLYIIDKCFFIFLILCVGWENENLWNLYNKVMENMYWIFFFGNNNYGFVYEFSGFIV